MCNQSARQWYEKVYDTVVKALCDSQEAEAITKALLAHYTGYTVTDHLLDTPLPIDPPTQKNLTAALDRICADEPLQYVLGSVDFCDETFQVDPRVLIPRPETEELVHSILQRHTTPPQQVLDLCTGSGCIAITLAKAYPKAIVEALDISEEALKVARENGKRLVTKVNFFQRNLLEEPLPSRKWDLIVSNPPYVLATEKKRMHRRVLAYEPAQALFVPNENPLCFYKRIAELAPQHLAPKGQLFVEINPAYSQAIATLFLQAPLQAIHIHQDIHGKDRWVTARK